MKYFVGVHNCISKLNRAFYYYKGGKQVYDVRLDKW
jgi:hypothetical protein